MKTLITLKLRTINTFVFLLNVLTILKTGQWPVWRVVWKLSQQGMIFTKKALLAKETVPLTTKAIRRVMDDCGIPLSGRGSLPLCYHAYLGSLPPTHPHFAGAFKTGELFRSTHYHQDLVGLALIEGMIDVTTYLRLRGVYRELDVELTAKFKKILQEETLGSAGEGTVEKHVSRLLAGESSEQVFQDLQLTMWPGMRNPGPKLEV
jgi:hypothetical protein